MAETIMENKEGTKCFTIKKKYFDKDKRNVVVEVNGRMIKLAKLCNDDLFDVLSNACFIVRNHCTYFEIVNDVDIVKGPDTFIYKNNTYVKLIRKVKEDSLYLDDNGIPHKIDSSTAFDLFKLLEEKK